MPRSVKKPLATEPPCLLKHPALALATLQKKTILQAKRVRKTVETTTCPCIVGAQEMAEIQEVVMAQVAKAPVVRAPGQASALAGGRDPEAARAQVATRDPEVDRVQAVRVQEETSAQEMDKALQVGTLLAAAVPAAARVPEVGTAQVVVRDPEMAVAQAVARTLAGVRAQEVARVPMGMVIVENL